MEHRSFAGSPSVIILCQEPSFKRGGRCVGAGSAAMSPVKKNDAEQERLVVLEEIGIEGTAEEIFDAVTFLIDGD
jgi:hypothetical protein